MKKILAVFLTVVLLCSAVPLSTLAFDQYVIYNGQVGCRLLDFEITQKLNSWLLWDVTFDAIYEDRVWETVKEHPNLVGTSVIPSFEFEGDTVTFNGDAVESGVTAVELLAENELVITTETARAEYQISITEETNGLPVVLIDTEGAPIPDKVDYVDSHISVLGAETYGGKDIYAAVAGIKLRGNSTMGFAKKPYRIKFDKKQDVFGLGKAKSWVLLANYLDPASIRNDVVYAFASRLNQVTYASTGFSMYVPRMRPVEVYLNGKYQGLYDMGDHIQVDGTRIDIDESGDELDDNDQQLFPEGNVGYYLEIEHESRVIPEYESEGAEYFTIRNTNDAGYTLYVQFKTPEFPSAEQKTYIQNYLQTVNDLIRSQSKAVWDYIDMDGFIDWYLVNELFKNTDSAFLSSIKLFKDKDGKLSMGPVWDFDLGAGAVAYNSVHKPTGWLTRTTGYCDWYENLFEMEEFVTAFEERWALLHESGVFDAIFTDIEALSAYLGDSAEQDFDMWHDTYVSEISTISWLTVSDIQTNYNWDVQIQHLTTYMKARIAWMDEQFGYSPVSSTTNLGGKPAIFGTPEYGTTLVASTLAVTPYGASVRYQWYADDVAISGVTSSSFTPDDSYIGKAITVKVTGSGSYKGSLTSDAVVLAKAANSYKTTQTPSLISRTDTTLVIKEREGYDISIDGVHWQTSGTFTGLMPNTLYRVQYRHGEFPTQQAGQPGVNTLYVMTDTASAPVDPEPPADILFGDADLDGAVDTSDAKLILRHMMQLSTLEGNALTAADYNADGDVNTKDVRALLIALVAA